METCRGATWGSEFPFCFLREGLVAAAETDERMLIVEERSRMAAESGKSAKNVKDKRIPYVLHIYCLRAMS
jgi:hypothetical protein